MAQTLGIIDLQWNGTKFDVEPGASFKLSGYKNNPVNVTHRTHRAQEWVHGEVSCVVPLKRGQSATQFAPGEEGELQVTCDSGQTYTIPDAFITDQPTFTGGQGGKGKVDWNFSSYEELIS